MVDNNEYNRHLSHTFKGFLNLKGLRKMNSVLWIVQILLAFMFLITGLMKAFNYAKAKESLPWVKGISKGLVTFIGVAELLAGVGFILPIALNILPVVTPVAAIGIAIIMILSALFHLRRKEYSGIVFNIVLLALAFFVAIGRM